MIPYANERLAGHIHYCDASGDARRLHRYIEQAHRLLFKWLNRQADAAPPAK